MTTRATPYDILFEPVRIGPVTARNRFYQVPHCNGMGYQRPRAEAAMRGMKAEGGWAVVCNQETEIHPTSDLSPFAEGRLWDDRDIPGLRLMTDAIHAHGSLAGIELAHNGSHAPNLLSRAPALAPSDSIVDAGFAPQARAMDKEDIRNLRRWHRDAARRAMKAGFDIIYVYAGHHMTIPHHFLLPQHNDRMDEYGGSLENRVRLTRELLEDTLEIAEGKCGVAFRFAIDEMQGTDGMQAEEEGRGVVELLAELPDLWDVNVADWPNDSQTTRFQPEDGYQTKYLEAVKQITSKPVVGVGRFTSPDMMASLVRKGVLDMIGAARPSISDPFLPKKIEEGRIDQIRECIGCNICVSADSQGVPIRCTQNPTMGEEWRRGWHPETIGAKGREEAALVVGSGPAGLECAMQLARRGYHVTLAEAGKELGGRVRREAGLNGLAAWGRVMDYRLGDLQQRGNVDIFTDSPLGRDEVLELGVPNVFLATGARWRRDGQGRTARFGIEIADETMVMTPDDVMDGIRPGPGPLVIYDDDHGYLAGVLATQLADQGCEVTFVTTANMVSPFTELTLEQGRVQKSLLERGVTILTAQAVAGVETSVCRLACVYTGQTSEIDCGTALLVTRRDRVTSLYDELRGHPDLSHVELIGDAAAPGLIADAVYSGHRAARNFERPAEEVEQEYFRREITAIEG
ncbi:FAD-dependent oxidoreductase [Roseovarius sp.]|uniref:oxidoreductase n=1 Tax=Roseovarius sp. TaxID=1486281 RepID=UPI003BAC00DC